MRPVSFKKVLIVNIFGIGDVLFTTPLISSLKAAYPDVQIGYLCNRRTAPLLEHNSQVDRVFIYARDELDIIRKRSRWGYWKVFGAFVQGIKEERFDIVLDVSLSGFTAFLTWWIGIPCRVGFDYKRRGLFLNKKIPFTGYEDKHVVEYYLDLLREIGVPVSMLETGTPVSSMAMKLPVTDEDARWAGEFLEQNCIRGPGPIIGLIPGGGESWGKDAFYKRWPIECFAKLADKFVEKFAAGIILMGGKNEEELCRQVAGLMRQRSLLACGKTSITQFAALARRCSLVVTNDGGPLHAAVAAGAKTVSIFGPVDDRVYGPYSSHNHRVVKTDIACRPCYRRFRRASCDHISCLHRINVEDVMRKVEEIL